MMQRIRLLGFGLSTTFAILGFASFAQAQAPGERFEVASIKAVRPTLVNTVSALQQRDIAKAKEAFESYDSAWNGIEVYINVRSRDLYRTLEQDFQKKIRDGLNKPNPDATALLPDAQPSAWSPKEPRSTRSSTTSHGCGSFALIYARCPQH
jgi:hypothetical protein